jgi:hypothetical protein
VTEGGRRAELDEQLICGVAAGLRITDLEIRVGRRSFGVFYYRQNMLVVTSASRNGIEHGARPGSGM